MRIPFGHFALVFVVSIAIEWQRIERRFSIEMMLLRPFLPPVSHFRPNASAEAEGNGKFNE